MCRHLLWPPLLAVALVWGSVGSAPAQPPKPDPPEKAADAKEPADPREAEVRKVVGQFLAAAKTGDLKAAGEVCDSFLLKVMEKKPQKPREFEAEITDVLVLSESAEVTVRQKYAKPVGDHSEFTLTCKLILTLDKKWKVRETKVRAVPARDR